MKLFYIKYEPKLIKFYVHNYAILYSEIFYIRFYDFSSHTILAVILRFLYGHFGYDLSTILRSDLTIRFFGALSDPCQNLDFDCLAYSTSASAVLTPSWSRWRFLFLGCHKSKEGFKTGSNRVKLTSHIFDKEIEIEIKVLVLFHDCYCYVLGPKHWYKACPFVGEKLWGCNPGHNSAL